MIQQHVTRSFGFLKTTAIGGLIFLLLPGDKPADRSIEKASGELQGSSD